MFLPLHRGPHYQPDRLQYGIGLKEREEVNQEAL